PTNRLPAAAEGIEELHQLLASHPATVVGDHPPVNTLGLNGLPFDAKLDLSGTGFQRIDETFTHPLVLAAFSVGSFDELLRPRRLHRQDTRKLARGHRITRLVSKANLRLEVWPRAECPRRKRV